MTSIYNCDTSELVDKASEELKKIESIKAPEWAVYVKTGVHKERPPIKNDWWYVRAASVLRKIYTLGPIGISKLRVKYGGKKNRGTKTEHFYKGSGSIIRKIMQQLEKEGFVKKDLKSVHKGRIITAKGKKFLDDVAGKISKVQVKQEVKKEEPVKEEKKEAVPKAKTKDVKKAETKQEPKKEIPKQVEQKPEVKQEKETKPEQKPETKQEVKEPKPEQKEAIKK